VEVVGYQLKLYLLKEGKMLLYTKDLIIFDLGFSKKPKYSRL